MGKTLVLALAALALIALTTPSGAQGRSGVHQGQFTSCSEARTSCLAGASQRGGCTKCCLRAFRVCMQTGVWDTYGRYGRRVANVARH
jgi:hypothetical protein